MGWGISKTELGAVVLFGLFIVAWFPWGLLGSFLRGAEEESGKRKKSGIGLV